MRLLPVLVLALVAMAHADMYFHNMRGSNNRLDEARRERTNANRLFDSQNNNRGGYNVGSLYYYEGSVLSLEWTNQHSCGDQNNNCEQIVQYMCDDLARDGTTTNTIPDNPAQCENFDCNTDFEFGMHESFDYYVDCRLRKRNDGLFTADRNLRGNSARFTRQNPNGNRRGYECPEERDYYPYWQPTPWRDVVVFTNDATRCEYYRTESANVKSRWACILPERLITENIRRNNPIIPITQEECEEITYEEDGMPSENATWTEFLPDPRLSAPECIETQWSRDNHLGNTVGGFPLYYNWTIPNIPHEHCVMRIRYNISTAEYDGFDPSVNSSLERVQARVFNPDNPNNPTNTRISELDVASRVGFTEMDEAYARGYVFRQNPVVKIFPDTTGNNFGLQLAINTNQFGRTFQDRSHTFAIRSRPEELEDVTIYNLNVRGKRGNIVQVYPGVEYDFVPNRLVVSDNSYLHVQWTGSNTNPNNNDGQGKQGTDRSNIVLLRQQNYPEGATPTSFGYWSNSYPAHLDARTTAFLGMVRQDREDLATLGNLQFGGEMSELDDAGTYYDLGPRKVTGVATYYYMCSRNNNFTNRSQKGVIIVQANAFTQRRVGINGGNIAINSHIIQIESGDLEGAIVFNIEEYSNSSTALEQARTRTTIEQFSPPPEERSSYLLIDPLDQFTTPGQMVEVNIALNDDNPPGNTNIYRANPGSRWTFQRLTTEVNGDRAIASTDQGGIFVAASPQDTALIAGLTVMGVFLLFIIILPLSVVIFFLIRRDKWQSLKESTRKTKVKVTRSFAKQV